MEGGFADSRTVQRDSLGRAHSYTSCVSGETVATAVTTVSDAPAPELRNRKTARRLGGNQAGRVGIFLQRLLFHSLERRGSGNENMQVIHRLG